MFIGGREVKDTKNTGEVTPGGFEVLEVTFQNGRVERFSKLMYDKIVTENSIDETELRNKRIFPIVEALLVVLRDWGIRLGELPYMSLLLNQSLDYNTKEAIIELWSQYMPKPDSPDDVDLQTVDRVLKLRKVTLDDVIKPDN